MATFLSGFGYVWYYANFFCIKMDTRYVIEHSHIYSKTQKTCTHWWYIHFVRISFGVNKPSKTSLFSCFWILIFWASRFIYFRIIIKVAELTKAQYNWIIHTSYNNISNRLQTCVMFEHFLCIDIYIEYVINVHRKIINLINDGNLSYQNFFSLRSLILLLQP